MGITICVLVMCGLGWYVWRQRVELRELRLQLAAAQERLAEHDAEALTREMAELDRQAEHEAELEAQKQRFDDSWNELLRTKDRLEVECDLRKEYAYVCRDCKQPDLNVQASRERSLRSVTKR